MFSQLTSSNLSVKVCIDQYIHKVKPSDKQMHVRFFFSMVSFVKKHLTVNRISVSVTA